MNPIEKAIEAGKLTKKERWAHKYDTEGGYMRFYDGPALTDAAHAKAVAHLAWGIVEWLRQWDSLNADYPEHELTTALESLGIERPKEE